jgi:hypothetical protein
MGFSDVLKKVFPFLSVAASLGGPLGSIGAGLVGKALGLATTPKAEDLSNILTDALSDPAKQAALQQAELDFQSQMAALGFKDAEALEELATEDRASARQREIAVRDYTPELGFYTLIGVFSYMVHYLFRYPVPTENRAMVYSMAGSIGTLLVTAATYFYGTTRGSENKSATLSSIASSAAEAGTKAQIAKH